MINDTLTGLLNVVHANQRDNTLKLVAADCAAECEELRCESLLRYATTLQSHPRDPGSLMSTGSRVYGRPTEDSDWDWVLYTSSVEVVKWLKANCGATCATKAFLDYKEEIGEQGLSGAYRFGPINVILVENSRQWKAWEDGTKYLISLCEGRGLKTYGPRTQEQAVKVFEFYRDKYLLRRHRRQYPPTEEAELGVSG